MSFGASSRPSVSTTTRITDPRMSNRPANLAHDVNARAHVPPPGGVSVSETVAGPRAFARRHPIVLRVGVLTEVERRRERAARLRQHLEAFAIELGGRREPTVDIEEDDLFQPDRGVATVPDFGAAERAVPIASELHGIGSCTGDVNGVCRRPFERGPVEAIRRPAEALCSSDGDPIVRP